MTETNEPKKDCAFQYAKITRGFGSRTTIVCDKTDLTLDEATELWNKYYPDCAKHIKDSDNSAEMVIWINMPDSNSFGEHLQYISTDAESDGVRIWETTKKYFPKTILID